MALGFHLPAPGDTNIQRRLGDVLARRLAGADLLGRLQVLRHARKKTGKLLPISPAAHPVKFDEDPHDQVAAGFSFDLPNDDADRFIRELTPVTREVFNGLTAQYRNDAFTLAGVSDVRLIEKIRDALAEIAQKGGTVEDFHAAVRKLTGDASVDELNAFTLDTAFQTAMQKAYSAGRLAQMREPTMVEALPFWQYWTVGDLRVRPEHAVLDGFLARAIDPVWGKIYPPSGFNCRCSVVPIPADEALKIDPDASEGGMERLPLLARALVPQQGFHTLIHA
jgi:SPP1 gp7 family putative phage head morphogenesis protein